MKRINYRKSLLKGMGTLFVSAFVLTVAHAQDMSKSAQESAMSAEESARSAAESAKNAESAKSAERGISSEASKVMSSCKTEVQKFCSEYKTQPTQAMDCLKLHTSALSKGCAKGLGSSESMPTE